MTFRSKGTVIVGCERGGQKQDLLLSLSRWCVSRCLVSIRRGQTFWLAGNKIVARLTLPMSGQGEAASSHRLGNEINVDLIWKKACEVSHRVGILSAAAVWPFAKFDQMCSDPTVCMWGIWVWAGSRLADTHMLYICMNPMNSPQLQYGGQDFLPANIAAT